MSGIKKYLSKAQKKETALVQAHIDAELVEKLKRKLKKENVTMVRFVEAAIMAYLEES